MNLWYVDAVRTRTTRLPVSTERCVCGGGSTHLLATGGHVLEQSLCVARQVWKRVQAFIKDKDATVLKLKVMDRVLFRGGAGKRIMRPPARVHPRLHTPACRLRPHGAGHAADPLVQPHHFSKMHRRSARLPTKSAARTTSPRPRLAKKT